MQEGVREEMMVFGSGGGGWAVTSRVFSTYGCPLKMVLSFKYLGRVISAVEDDWPEVIQKLAKARMV